MNFIILSVAILSLIYPSVRCECDNSTEIVCYWGSWSIYREDIGKFTTEDIDTSICTKIIYTFVGLDLNLDIASLDSNTDITLGGFANFTSLNEKNPCLKRYIAIGGWNEGSAKFSVLSSTEEGRRKFANNALRFLVYYGFDGLDLDWEYPTARGGISDDGKHFAALLKIVKETLKPWGLDLSIAVAIEDSLIGTGYNITEIAEDVDEVHLMAYDYVTASSPVTGLSSPMSAIEVSVSKWLSGGLPREKLILGLPAYGRNFVLADPEQNGIGASVKDVGTPGVYTEENGFLAYYEVLDILQYDEYQKISTDGTNYAFLNDDWMTYEDENTVRAKTKYALDQNLRGVMLWSLDTDDFRGLYGKKYPLLNAINDAIHENTNSI